MCKQASKQARREMRQQGRRTRRYGAGKADVSGSAFGMLKKDD